MEPTLAPTPAEARPQRLHATGLLALLALLSAFIPLSTDMYLPALPKMTKMFQAPEHLVNLTIILFFLFYSLGTLLWGPLSDKYGRRPILLWGLTIYLLASACCAIAGNVYHLIIFRILQALAGGAAPAMATALVKDLYSGRQRERRLALIQSMVMIAPIIAPLIGALLLKFTSWRGIFWTLAGFGALALVWSLLLCETVVKRYTGTVLQTWAQLGTVLRNPGFTSLMIIFALILTPLYSYLAASSYIYVDEFKLSPMAYSGFFMLNACCAVIAPFCYLQLSRRLHGYVIIPACFAVIALSGVAICTLGRIYPWLLALSIMPATLTMGIIRPPSTHLLLEQEQQAVGSASALINCTASLTGSLGMLLMSLHWTSKIVPLGVVHLAAGVICGLLWWALAYRPFIRPLPEVEPVHG